MKKKILLLSLVFVSASILVYSLRYKFVKIYHMNKFFSVSPNKNIKATEKEFLEDRQILSQYALFAPSAGTKDAGPYLNYKVHWEIGEVHHQGDLAIPAFIHKELQDDWAIKKPLFKKMGINFQWMKELLKYDYWNPEENSPVFSKDKKFQTYAIPVPTYRDLETWAKLRYLYGKENDDVQNALKEVRHLMRLIWTNDYMISSQVVIEMLKIENQFEEILTPKEILDWKFIPHDHLMRAKRHFYSLPSVVDIRLPDETFDKMTNSSMGVCMMLLEGSMSYLIMREFLENELKYSYKRMLDRVDNSRCRNALYRNMWEDKNWDLVSSLKGIKVLGKNVTYNDLKNNDDLNAIVGFILMDVSTPNRYQYKAE